MARFNCLFAVLTFAVLLSGCSGDDASLAQSYTKAEYNIPMRDGKTLYTAVYSPRDTSQSYPFLMKRSPYTSAPYGPDEFPGTLGPVGSSRFQDAGYIFVYQDVRGRFLSEGTFQNMTPHVPDKTAPSDIDESSDMYDTVEFLLETVPNNNGRVGIWGISYPGFYTAASIIDSHPAIKAASPQAAIGDWFVGDDFHHHGAFFLQDAYGFFSFFESPAPNPTDSWGERLGKQGDDSYDFFLDMGSVANAPREEYFSKPIAFWDSVSSHPDYDAYWQSRNIIPHMKGVTTSVMNVAGLFDAEDPHGPIEIYKSIEANNPGITNTLVLGPWFHGGWVRSAGDIFGNISFEQQTGVFYTEEVDFPFFEYHLKDVGTGDLPEALAFSSGSNEWHRLDSWPPADMETVSLYLLEGGALGFDAPESDGVDTWVSDPGNPVPYTRERTMGSSREYMVEDQRFVEDRDDVLIYTSEVLTEDLTLAGPLTAELFFETDHEDADFAVKVIDVFPDDTPEYQEATDKYMPDVPMAGYQMQVRWEVFRGRYRESYEFPKPFEPGVVDTVRFDTPHVFHTFKAGHRIAVHVQSSYFPLMDRNPQKWVDNIYLADDADFEAANHTLHRSAVYPSRIIAGRYRD